MNLEQFEKEHAGMDFTRMSPPCFGITYFNANTQRAYAEWLGVKLEEINKSNPPYAEVNGTRVLGRWESLERFA